MFFQKNEFVRIGAICKYYPDLETAFVWENYAELYGEGIDHDQIAIIALGKEIKKIVSKNNGLYRRLLKILEEAIENKSIFLSNMIEDPLTETIEDKKKVLTSLRRGMLE